MSLGLAWVLVMLAHAAPWLRAGAPSLSCNPYKLNAVVGLLTIVPLFTMLALGYPSAVLDSLSTRPQEILADFGLLYAAMTLSVYAGIFVMTRHAVPGQRIALRHDPRTVTIASALLIGIFLFATAQKVAAAGGIGWLFANLGRRTELLAGTGIWSALTQPAAFFCMFLLVHARAQTGRPGWPAIIAVLALLFVGLGLFGGRKDSMYLLVFTLIAVDAYLTRLRPFSPVVIGSALVLVGFFMVLGQARGSTFYESFVDLDAVVQVLREASYVESYAFILDHFGPGNFWHGATFVDLAGRLGLADIHGLRSPLDEGAYVRSLYQGMSVFPPTDYDMMFKSSWPPESFGNGYLNFGVAGVLLFGLVRGAVIGFWHRRCITGHFPGTSFLFMVFCVFNFHLTNLRLIQFGVVVLFVSLFARLMPRRAPGLTRPA